jgi:hypothetical protein
MPFPPFVRKSIFLFGLFLASQAAIAQALLQKSVRVNANNTPLNEVLRSIGSQGGFSFSYNSNVIAGKRLVTLNATSVTVQTALDALLKGTCTYKTVGNHIVLQASKEKYYQITGYVIDATSGAGVPEASVYEQQQLLATVTDKEGFFTLKLRHKYPTADIRISKELYQDTVVYLGSAEDKVYRLHVRPATLHSLDEVVVSSNPRKRFLDNLLNRLLLSRNLKAQTRNITRFIAERPLQTSVIPGVGTHGKLGASVVNKFSLNIFGGYTAGVDGLEIGGLFNLDGGDVGVVQVGGLFNVVEGNVSGVQVGGLSNYVGGKVDGVQVGGISNLAIDTVDGVQLAGVANLGKGVASGVQIAGVANVANSVKGTQIAGVVNYARKLEGIQIGLINLADSLEGTAIGLINLSKNGYHKLAFYSDEVVWMNTALKTGTPALYTILLSGFNPGSMDKAFTFGAGLGHQSRFSKSWSLTTEATVQYLYLGDWDHTHFLYRLRPSLCYQPTKWLSFFTGPSISMYEDNKAARNAFDYIQNPTERGHGNFGIVNDMKGWFGWQFGVALF